MTTSNFGDRLDQLPQSDIFLVSISGLLGQLKRFFPNKEVPVVMYTGSTHLRAMARKAGNKLTFPFFAVKIATAEENNTGYNPFILNKRGVQLGISTSQITDGGGESASVQILHLTPAIVTLDVMLVCDDVKDVYFYMQRWLASARHRYLDFQLEPEESNAPISIRVEMDRAFNFPDLEIEELGEKFNPASQLTMQTYHGVVGKKIVITGQKVDLSSVQQSVDGASAQLIASVMSNLAGKTWTKFV